MHDLTPPTRIFKSAWFAKAARKARIRDDELCDAILEAMQGQADDLGGGVYKKRLSNNTYRSIILAKSGTYWIFQYLFAKKSRENVSREELVAFRLLAKAYANLSKQESEAYLQAGHFVEICHGD
jgi:hypothetical protein